MIQRIDLNLKWLVAVILAIVAALAALPYLSSREADTTMRALTQVAARERAYDQLIGYLTDAETGQRGFVITGDPGFLADYRAGLDGIAPTLRTLRAAAADDAERAAVRQIGLLVERKLTEMDQTIVLRRAQGYEAAARTVADLRGKRDMDSLRALIGQRIADLAERRVSLRERMRATLGYNTVLGIAASLVSGTVVCIALYVASRNLRERALAAEQARRAAAAEAGQAALAQARNQRLEVTAQMLQALDSLTANAELPAILPVFLARLMPGTGGAVYLYRSSRDFLQRAATWGAVRAHEELINPSDCWGLRFGTPHPGQDAAGLRCPHCVRLDGSDDDALQQLCVPMVSQGEVIGLLVAAAPAAGAPIEKTVAVTAAEQLALGISNINLREMLRRQSTVDELTGLYNRRYFDEALKREVFRAERMQTPFSLVMVDLDHFKRMNDTHGHDAGDLVLQAAARCLQDGIRRSDLACRYGGEELALLLSDCDAASALRCAEAIRAAIAGLRLDHRGTRLPAVTASFGVAAWPAQGAQPDQLLKAADRALYASKHAGRDRVTLA